MKIDTRCKVCQKPITFSIDDDYATAHDPYRLVPMATCNHCYDQRQEKRRLEIKIQFICQLLIGVSDKQRQKIVSRWQEPLEHWLEKYTVLLCTLHGKRSVVCDESIVRSLLEHPQDWAMIMSRWSVYIARDLV